MDRPIDDRQDAIDLAREVRQLAWDIMQALDERTFGYDWPLPVSPKKAAAILAKAISQLEKIQPEPA